MRRERKRKEIEKKRFCANYLLYTKIKSGIFGEQKIEISPRQYQCG
jgi:hypothetical protein